MAGSGIFIHTFEIKSNLILISNPIRAYAYPKCKKLNYASMITNLTVDFTLIIVDNKNTNFTLITVDRVWLAGLIQVLLPALCKYIGRMVS